MPSLAGAPWRTNAAKGTGSSGTRCPPNTGLVPLIVPVNPRATSISRARILALFCFLPVAFSQLSDGRAAPSIFQNCTAEKRERAGNTLTQAWTALRQNRLTAADSLFRDANANCRTADAHAGLGYVSLRRDELSVARENFAVAIQMDSAHYDALIGAGLAEQRDSRFSAARRMFERALLRVPNDSTALWHISRLPVEIDTTPLPPRIRPAGTVVTARAGRRRIEVLRDDGAFHPLFIKAVNIGAALPGRYPSEFPVDDGTYDRWLALVDSMGGNAVRMYTIHPPHFYRALKTWNEAHPSRPIWLLHGVWTELPPGPSEEDYDDRNFLGEFQTEMRRVVDLLHGNAIIPHRPGHASGRYAADVSKWTIGYIIGREWEPHSVIAYHEENQSRTSYTGRFVSSAEGNAMESWVAAACDYMVSYEMDGYNAQRPIAYTNWPTLDPLHHPTESTRQEEYKLMRQFGHIPPEGGREYDNDAIGLDATRMLATSAYHAGVFSSYHAYPYYPDFLVLDESYRRAQSPEGPSAYFGYIDELVRHHGDMPVVISEYGVPSSRGNAHLQPQGWDHGGHSEQEQATINARLTRDIHAAGSAGVGLFAIIDEWFKKNWLVIDFEVPLERNRLWFNALDAEQNYGVVAMRPGKAENALVIDGDGGEWRNRGAHYSAKPDTLLPYEQRLHELRVLHDEAYVYFRLTVGAIDWSKGRYLIGVSTVAGETGDTRMPYTNTVTGTGLEFVLDLNGPSGSHLLVDEPYNLYRFLPIEGTSPVERMAVYNRPFTSAANSNGRYDTLMVQPNRRRIARDGRIYPAQLDNRSFLLHARQASTTLADWFSDAATGVIEIRIPWGMFHVLDPSSLLALHGMDAGGQPAGRVTDGFRFFVQSYDARAPLGGGDKLPRSGNRDAFGEAPLWKWSGWEEPTWHEEIKPLFNAMRETFLRLTDSLPAHR